MLSSFYTLSALAGAALAIPAQMNQINPLLAARGACGANLDGNGNPNNDFLHRQVTDVITCGDQPCSVETSGQDDFNWVQKSGDGTDFTDGGLAVQESVSLHDMYSCNGAAGDVICVWADVPYVGYTVEGGCVLEGPKSDAPANYYCVFGAESCRNNGDEYWCYGNDGVS